MKKLDVYTQILRDAVRSDLQVEDVLLHALVPHTHSIALRRGVALDDVQPSVREPRLVLAPLTRTLLAHLVASLWPKSEELGRDDFWFAQYGSVTHRTRSLTTCQTSCVREPLPPERASKSTNWSTS